MSAAQIGEACYLALLAEVSATPKPGLVDRANCGAHRDMDFALFQRSAESLRGYYPQIAAGGAATATLPPQQAFVSMRPLGVVAEKAMLAATGGVNTHKGAIFSLGLTAAAAGRLQSLGRPLRPESVCACAASFVLGITQLELAQSAAAATRGAQAFRLHGASGARGEAEAGFPHALQHGLPAYRRALRLGASENDALLEALLHILAHMQDTNILLRCGPEAAKYARTCAEALLAKKHPIGSAPRREALEKMDADFIPRNISPGGCADLMALCWLLNRLDTAF